MVWMVANRLDDNGVSCQDSSAMLITLSNSLDEDKGIRLFPNPTTGELYLHFDNPTLSREYLQIIDLWGRVVQAERLQFGIEEHKFTIAALPAGIYFVRVLDAGIPIVLEKVVKY
jgi:hypothetical protein